MNIQLEKIELIKRLADVESEAIINKLKAILEPSKKKDDTDYLMESPKMVQRIQEARQEIRDGKGVRIDIEDLWK